MEQAMSTTLNLEERNAEIAKVDESITNLEARLSKAKQAERLNEISEFKSIVLEGLFTTEVNKLTTSLAMDTHTKESEEVILVRLRSIKILRDYIKELSTSSGYIQDQLDREKIYRLQLINDREDIYE